MHHPILPALAFAALAALAVPAHAQDSPDLALDQGVFAGDFLVVGAGVVSMPSYEGSNDRVVSPAAAVLGRVGGIEISPRAGGLALDFIPGREGERIGLNLGPVLRYRGNRSRTIKDPVVARLGKLDAVIEGGIAAGVTLHRVFHAYDRLSIGSDFRWDVTGKGGGMSIAPSVTYFTPLSRSLVAGARAGVEFVDHRYATYNHGVSLAGSQASGLPPFRARGGLKEINMGAFAAYDLSGNFLDGGLGIGVGAQYGRLQGSAAETPLTSIRGSRDQWYVGGGLLYTF